MVEQYNLHTNSAGVSCMRPNKHGFFNIVVYHIAMLSFVAIIVLSNNSNKKQIIVLSRWYTISAVLVKYVAAKKSWAYIILKAYC